MTTPQIYVNLPVKDLQQSIAFFTKLGYTFNPQFTDHKATCMVISDSIYFMLIVEEFFQTFTNKPIADAKQVTEAILCLSAESREAVDEITSRAVAAGGTIPRKAQDYGWMYTKGFQDLDGHLWEYIFMDQNAIPEN
ncbi:VOC family protein [Chitinophaga sp. Cy-1792]|uniref:VOC family protein n=1 Tax=Chitinophaga sp. Cy-1792 TaxID=2608339 RepID=UPI0014249E60|nr:VOC family protein [Chitinophaga sp. Cy-1792]NIG55561.1 glyoxalase/bleomycin resistance/extradiol dioxygenase family protein [Chitinophaga sp. Cy-1792]